MHECGKETAIHQEAERINRIGEQQRRDADYWKRAYEQVIAERAEIEQIRDEAISRIEKAIAILKGVPGGQ